MRYHSGRGGQRWGEVFGRTRESCDLFVAESLEDVLDDDAGESFKETDLELCEGALVIVGEDDGATAVERGRDGERARRCWKLCTVPDKMDRSQ